MSKTQTKQTIHGLLSMQWKAHTGGREWCLWLWFNLLWSVHSLFVHRSRETSLRFEVFILENPCGGRVVVTVRTILGTFFLFWKVQWANDQCGSASVRTAGAGKMWRTSGSALGLQRLRVWPQLAWHGVITRTRTMDCNSPSLIKITTASLKVSKSLFYVPKALVLCPVFTVFLEPVRNYAHDFWLKQQSELHFPLRDTRRAFIKNKHVRVRLIPAQICAPPTLPQRVKVITGSKNKRKPWSECEKQTKSHLHLLVDLPLHGVCGFPAAFIFRWSPLLHLWHSPGLAWSNPDRCFFGCQLERFF